MHRRTGRADGFACGECRGESEAPHKASASAWVVGAMICSLRGMVVRWCGHWRPWGRTACGDAGLWRYGSLGTGYGQEGALALAEE